MRLAVIVHRYSDEVAGGAEKLAHGFAQAAAQRGWTIEVWTTCARSHYSWENFFPAGASEINRALVRRFPVTHWDHFHRAQLEFRLTLLGTLPFDEQLAWLETGAHSAPLYRHIRAHASEFDALIVLPYAMPLAHYAVWCAPNRAIVLPCLHDEAYAYLQVTRLLMENARGVIFNSPEERDLALCKLKIQPQRFAVMGAGVELPALDLPRDASRRDLVYVGRLEHGKNTHLLYQYVQRYFEAGGDIRLIVLGDGPVRPPAHPAFEYRGFVSEADKARACADALAICQPSVNESFSFTIMEAWVCQRPVLVHHDCAVTQAQVRRCDGGLWFRDYEEFVGALEWLARNPERAKRMGANGADFVRANFTWDVVLDRFARIFAAWQNSNGAARRA
jgi:glycosyltransferase involved in cell wall biosynthesis